MAIFNQNKVGKLTLMGDEFDHAQYRESVKDFFQTKIENNSSTWDGPKLNKYVSQRVFIYGTMKKGFARNVMLGEDATPLGVGFTSSPYFKMYQVKDGGFPLALTCPEIKDHPSCGRIYGELWDVPISAIFSLDYYESNNLQFTRRKLPIKICVPGTDDTMLTYAWMYVANHDYWNKRIDQIRLLDLVTKKKDPSFAYFIYMKKYEDEYNARKKLN